MADLKQCSNKFFYILYTSETDKLSTLLDKYPSFSNQLCIGLFNSVSLFLIPGVFLVVWTFWVFPQNKWILVINLRSNNFICLFASIFVFITLIVSTQAMQTCEHLVDPDFGLNFSVSLCSWHILQLIVVYSLLLFTISHETSLSILWTFSCLHDCQNGLLCAFKWTIRYFIYKIKGNIGTVSHQIVQHIFQNWSRYLLCFWCGVLHLKIVEDCIFLCILQYFHWPSDACYILLLVEWMNLQVPRRFSGSYKCGAQPRKHGTRTWTFVYVPPFSFAYQYPFNCANVF